MTLLPWRRPTTDDRVDSRGSQRNSRNMAAHLMSHWDTFLLVVCPILVLWTSIAAFASYNSYPFLAPEMLIFWLSGTVAGLILGGLLAVCPYSLAAVVLAGL